jgi:twitching motility protein PilI
MADRARARSSLRQFQQRLAERLTKAQSGALASFLAVEVGPLRLLLPLAESGEISSPPVVQPLPRSERWFLGVTTQRGRVVGVVDLAVFLGVRDKPQPGGTYLALGDALDMNCLLRVDRLLGLRSREQFKTRTTDDGDSVLEDADGQIWRTLSLANLANDAAFLKVFA